jgi:hypothetical protein
MHAAGTPLETIADLVGHSGTYMTDAYRHLLDASRPAAGSALDVYLTARTGTHSGTRLAVAAAVPAN